MALKTHYDFRWASETAEAFSRRFPRGCKVIGQLYELKPSWPARALAESQFNWEAYKKAVKIVDKLPDPGELLHKRVVVHEINSLIGSRTWSHWVPGT